MPREPKASVTRRILIWAKEESQNPWTLPTLGIFSGLDYIAPIIPTQTTLILAATLHPKRWRFTAGCFAIGGALGAMLLAYAIEVLGLELVQRLFGDALDSAGLVGVSDSVRQYGVGALFILSCIPFPVRSAVAISALAGLPFFSIGLAVLGGRLLGFSLVAFLAARAPGVLAKAPGFGAAFRSLTEIQGGSNSSHKQSKTYKQSKEGEKNENNCRIDGTNTIFAFGICPGSGLDKRKSA